MRRYVLIVVVLGLTVTGCTTIAVLSGPRTLSSGDTATYVVSLDGPDGHDLTLYVASDVPASWTLQSSSYTGTIGGVPVTSTGTVVSDPYPSLLPPPGDGMQRIWLADGPFDIDPADSAELTLDFSVDSVPQGEFVLKFWFISSGDPNISSRSFAAVTVNREPRLFEFVRSWLVGEGALEENVAAAASPDGRAVLLGGFNDPVLSVFDRDPLTGVLSHNHVLNLGGGLTGIYDLVFAPGSNHVYGGGNDFLAFLERDSASGEVSLVQLLQEGIGGVSGLDWAFALAVSPDRANVYVAARSDDAVSEFSREGATGELAHVASYWNGTGGIQGLDDPTAISVSSDGTNVYATGTRTDTIVVFDRAGTGELSFRQVVQNGVAGVSGLDSPRSLAVTADGAHVYAAGFDSNSVAVFVRQAATGELSFVSAVTEGVGGVVGILAASGLVLSPDDRFLFVSGLHSLAVFGRDPATGELSFLQADFDGEGTVTGISYPYGPAVGTEGDDLFYPSASSMAVFSSRIFADGFESGATTSW